ncbi:hypothetical protein FFWV33_13200 [Flavobacterium faecale]|uniref:Uncharacterized protein n=1 Tax=Flavobacterium faecale TaxID=1355330 RepID=A0A2S1LF52_9FLAO|nr:hypothetical protein [Flavobacterium faecale]AWG22412.1 hypothetical protein FFWV33_13200 [Flavobacterium faecale]
MLTDLVIKALIFSIIPTLITLFVTEKVKGKIKNSFEEKLEIVKKKHTIEISTFQTELNNLKSREIFKFTKLHEKRFDILENIYKLINKSQNDLQFYVCPVKRVPEGKTFDQLDDSLNENFRKAHNNFVEYYSDNKIYLDEQIEELIDKYLVEVSDIYNDYSENHFLAKFDNKPNPETFKKSAYAYKKIPEKIIPIKKQIEIKFKELLEV